jgi:hypothetical protein
VPGINTDPRYTGKTVTVNIRTETGEGGFVDSEATGVVSHVAADVAENPRVCLCVKVNGHRGLSVQRWFARKDFMEGKEAG